MFVVTISSITLTGVRAHPKLLYTSRWVFLHFPQRLSLCPLTTAGPSISSEREQKIFLDPVQGDPSFAWAP